MHIAAAVVCALLGFGCGTLLQVVVFRTPIRERVWGVRAHCGNCGEQVKGVARLPLGAYLSAKNRCRTCDARLWSRWPWLEVVTAVTWAAVAAKFGWAWALPAYLVTFAAFVVIVVVDLRHYVIPNRVLYPALISSGLVFGLAAAIEGRPEALFDALIGMAGAWLFFAFVWVASPRSMGFGDVRLAALIGLITGWMGVGNVMIGLFVGILAGAIVGLVFMALRFLTRRDPMPYGPFLVLGGVVSVFWGQTLADWYLG